MATASNVQPLRASAPQAARSQPQAALAEQSGSLDDVMTLEAFQALRASLFPSMNALLWFMRRHRPLLVERGALLVVGGKKVIDLPRFEAAVREAGHADAVADQRGGARRRGA